MRAVLSSERILYVRENRVRNRLRRPDVPTTSEAGFPGLQSGNRWGLAAPRGTDQKIVDRLAGEVRAALVDPAVASRYAGLGTFRGGQSPAEFAAQMQAKAAKWKKVIETAGLRAE